jgi:hypothetical protein
MRRAGLWKPANFYNHILILHLVKFILQYACLSFYSSNSYPQSITIKITFMLWLHIKHIQVFLQHKLHEIVLNTHLVPLMYPVCSFLILATRAGCKDALASDSNHIRKIIAIDYLSISLRMRTGFAAIV